MMRETKWQGEKTSKQIAKARHLRHGATDAEKKLWGLLRSRQPAECKFRRQVLLGRFIVDFVCFEKRLVLELDGGHHQDQAADDEQRTTWLESQGFRVLRFWNHQVLTEPAAVQEAILLVVGRAVSSSPSPRPSPAREEGANTRGRVGMTVDRGAATTDCRRRERTHREELR